CFGCGQPDHCINTYPEVLDILNKGIIKCNTEGRLTMSNGARMPKQKNKTLVNAVKKLQALQAHFITLAVDSYYNSESEDSNNDYTVMPAEHTLKLTKKAHILRFEEVFLPQKSEWVKNLDKQEASPFKIAKCLNIPAMIPIDIHLQTFNPQNDNIIIKDVQSKPRQI
ncbi:hypothetical protein OBBRIDRAFT_742419, partial [Obba rivulosa]